MPKFERKAEVLEAFIYDGSPKSFEQLTNWSDQAVRRGAMQRIVISGRNSRQHVEPGCWVVKDCVGYHVFTPEELEKHFSLIDEVDQKEVSPMKTPKESTSKSKSKAKG